MFLVKLGMFPPWFPLFLRLTEIGLGSKWSIYKHEKAMCQMCLQIMEYFLVLLRFFKDFLCIIDNHSYLNCCFFTKLSQIKYLINVHILVYQHAKCDSRLWKVLWFDYVFLIFIYILKCYNFIKLLQFIC